MDKCDSLVDAAVETVIVAIELGSNLVTTSPAKIAKIVNSPEVQRAIQMAATEAGNQLLANQIKSKTITNANREKMLTDFKGKLLSGTAASVDKLIKESAQYKKLEAQLDQLKCSFDQSKTGVWVNKNQKLLVIVGTIVAVGGISYLYYSRQGDKPVDWALSLTKSHFKGKLTGSLELGVSDIKFLPSSRNVVVKGYAKGDFEGIAYKFDLSFASLDGKVVGSGVYGSVAIPLNNKILVSTSASSCIDPTLSGNATYQLDLGLDINNVAGTPSLKIKVNAMMKNNLEKAFALGMGWSF